jgi:23S rRNA G2445 N2-methylase RlmL
MLKYKDEAYNNNNKQVIICMGLNERGEHYPWAKSNLEALKFVGIIDFTKCKIKDIAQKWSTFPH